MEMIVLLVLCSRVHGFLFAQVEALVAAFFVSVCLCSSVVAVVVSLRIFRFMNFELNILLFMLFIALCAVGFFVYKFNSSFFLFFIFFITHFFVFDCVSTRYSVMDAGSDLVSHTSMMRRFNDPVLIELVILLFIDVIKR